MHIHKTAIITGSATGVGAATALRFAKIGYAVTINYSKSKAEAEATASECRKLGAEVLLVQAAVGDDAAVRKMIHQTWEAFGGIDVLVNNAATTHFISHTDLEAVTDDIWLEILQVNVLGSFHACRAAMPYLKARRGNIVSVSSVAGLQGQGSSIPYAASKAALNSLTRSLARAFAPEVRVNAVAPGPIKTRWLAEHMEHIDRAVKQTPLQRAADPEDIADAIIYLATGTSLTTGQVLVVDGGRTI